jgi:hypothetical protein
MSDTWPVQSTPVVPCRSGICLCVSLKHGLVIMSDFVGSNEHVLSMYSLVDGSLVRSVGSRGRDKGQFNWRFGGLCVSPDGDSVLVAESINNRVQQVLIVDGSWVRFIAEGVLYKPHFVDCNADFIVVSQNYSRISVLSWADGSVRAQFGSEENGSGQLYSPRGVRLLADGSGIVVADTLNSRLCVFALSGEFVAAVGSKEQGVTRPFDVLECTSDGSFIVANVGGDCQMVKLSRAGIKLETFGDVGRGFFLPASLAALPGGGFVVRDLEEEGFRVFRGLDLRKAWITACVETARHGVAH